MTFYLLPDDDLKRVGHSYWPFLHENHVYVYGVRCEVDMFFSLIILICDADNTL